MWTVRRLSLIHIFLEGGVLWKGNHRSRLQLQIVWLKVCAADRNRFFSGHVSCFIIRDRHVLEVLKAELQKRFSIQEIVRRGLPLQNYGNYSSSVFLSVGDEGIASQGGVSCFSCLRFRAVELACLVVCDNQAVFVGAGGPAWVILGGSQLIRCV